MTVDLMFMCHAFLEPVCLMLWLVFLCRPILCFLVFALGYCESDYLKKYLISSSPPLGHGCNYYSVVDCMQVTRLRNYQL